MFFTTGLVTDKGTVKEINQDAMMLKVAMTKEHGRIAFGLVCDGCGVCLLERSPVLHMSGGWKTGSIMSFPVSLPMKMIPENWMNPVITDMIPSSLSKATGPISLPR